MIPERWKRVEELFGAAVELPPAERAAWLATACGTDKGLRDEVEDLLRADAGSNGGGFITGAIVGAARELAQRAEAARVGELVGPYRLTGVVGHGGMGSVYMAERDDAQYRATVAVKFVRGAREDMLSRFRAERQILADLSHPNIARLLDGGAAKDGSPYLVMEYVDGVPIDRYCDARGLGLRERIGLFRTVCAAVQYAHQHLVVHRDLKPSNILVSRDGSPKLVDFGIAKLLASDGENRETTGRLGLMTPSYASPEQVTGAQITVGADVYSLGVVLYLLLTGRLPLELADASPLDLVRAITETEPPAPSRTVREPLIRRRLAGDLDRIVLKALRKNPADRYASVADLGEDLRRWLAGEPVAARSGTWSYRARRFAARHALGVAATAGVLALIAGLTVFYTVRLARERDRARVEAAKAEKVAEFLAGLFQVSDPGIEVQGRDLTAQQLLDRGAARIDSELVAQPEIQANLMTVIGRVYLGMGLRDAGAAQLERALAVLRTLDRADDAAMADALSGLSVVRRGLGDYKAADTLGTQALALLRSSNHPPNLNLANIYRGLAEARRVNGDNAAADSLNRAALAIHRALLPAEHRSIADDLNNIALVVHDRGQYPEAERIHRESLAMRRRLFPEDHPDVSNGMNNLALTLAALGAYDEAAGLLRDALRLRQRTLGRDESRTLNTMRNLGRVLSLQGDWREAEAMQREALARMGHALPPNHPYVANVLGDMALVLSERGAHDSAATLARRALEMQQRRLGVRHPGTLSTTLSLARILAARGDAVTAEQMMREAHAGQLEILEEGHPATAATLYQLAALLLAEERYGEAEPMAREALRIQRLAFPAGHREIGLTETLLREVVARLARG